MFSIKITGERGGGGGRNSKKLKKKLLAGGKDLKKKKEVPGRLLAGKNDGDGKKTPSR